jgi:signal transduction histidine kinase
VGHNDEVAGRIRWLVAFFLRAERRGAAPGGWAVAFDVMVAVGAAAGAVRQTANTIVAGRAVVVGGAPGRLVHHGIAGQVPLHAHAWFAVLAAAAMTGLPLAFRRYYPISVWLVIAAAIAFVSTAGAVPPVALGAVGYAAFSAIVHSRYRNLAIAIVVVPAVTVALATGRLDNELPRFPAWLTPVLVVLLVAAAGFGIRELRRRLADSAAKLRRAGAEARAATEAALAAERSRIAAELHDVVTHNVSVMIVQAGAARKIMSSSPADAEEALLAAEASGREAMTELRNLLGLLSPSADGSGGGAGPAALTPQPGLEDLDTLIGRVSAAGLPAGLRVTGESRPLPPGADLAAYRVVQEGLTNVLRHAGQATATVAVDWGDDLVITVTDDGGREPGDASAGRADGTPGRGLLGLRERLALYGATLAAGPQSGGGWLLRAVMPAPERGTP